MPLFPRAGWQTPLPRKVSGEGSLSDNHRQRSIAVAEGASDGGNHSLRRIEVNMPRRRSCGYSAHSRPSLHFVEFQGLSG